MSMKIKSISTEEVNELLKQGKNLSIIDVREDQEVAQGIIPQAVHIPLQQIQARIHEIDKDKEHILVCRSGNRSGMACDFLQQMGYNVLNMAGGMLDWNGEIK